MAKLRWAEIDGMKYVGVYEDDYDHCARCSFLPAEMDTYCQQVKTCDNLTYVPLEPQHIPNLRVKGKTKWRS